MPVLKMRYIALQRYRKPGDPVLADARGQLDAAMLEKEIRTRGESLTADQRDRLAVLLHSGGGNAR